ncbi:hypothetical protein [uncultured Gimesia sp.]|uniref:hypothetical protein n=1 Tax=uncultured Gimesia sp. TaxID=1678688 RepID=UPI0030D70309|tara:strand:- start:69581 stop:70264 length:684 start_codon:yes stop_codon:yes gene_type:complete
MELIPIDQLPVLIKSIQDLQRPPHDEKVESLIRDTRFEAQLSRKSVYGFPRISSGAIAAITGLLAAFPEKFSRIYSSHAQTNLADTAKYAALLAEREQIFSTFFLIAFIFAGILFCITWLSERRDEELTESAMCSAAREELFRELVYQLGRDTDELKFSTRIFVELVSSYLRFHHNISSLYRRFVPLWRPKISTIVTEKIALVHLEELENRGGEFGVLERIAYIRHL